MTINPAAVPVVHQRAIGRYFLDMAKAFYENPENLKRFEEWQAARRKEKQDVKANET